MWLVNHTLGDKLAVAHTDQLIISVINCDNGEEYVCVCVCVCPSSVCVYVCVCLYVFMDLTFIPTVYQHISLHLSVNLVNIASEPSQITWSHHTEEDKETSTDRSRLILSLPKVYL